MACLALAGDGDAKGGAVDACEATLDAAGGVSVDSDASADSSKCLFSTMVSNNRPRCSSWLRRSSSRSSKKSLASLASGRKSPSTTESSASLMSESASQKLSMKDGFDFGFRAWRTGFFFTASNLCALVALSLPMSLPNALLIQGGEGVGISEVSVAGEGDKGKEVLWSGEQCEGANGGVGGAGTEGAMAEEGGSPEGEDGSCAEGDGVKGSRAGEGAPLAAAPCTGYKVLTKDFSKVKIKKKNYLGSRTLLKMALSQKEMASKALEEVNLQQHLAQDIRFGPKFFSKVKLKKKIT